MAEKPNKRNRNSSFAAGLFTGVLAFILGALISEELFSVMKVADFVDCLRDIAWFAAALAAAFVLQIALHEGGHLVCGWMTGYRFVSFRIGSWMVQRENGKLHWHCYSLAGTCGQCLLAPPEMTDGKMPYKLYNLGGALANLIAAALAGGLIVLCRDVWAARVFFEMLCLVGVLFALLNGVPLWVIDIANDGANACDLGKDQAALWAFWAQLSINAKQADGTALRDMPEEWFAMPAESMDSAIVTTQAVLQANRLMDEKRFAETAQAIDAILDSDAVILPLHFDLLLSDRLTCALLLGEEDVDWLVKLWNEKEMLRFRRKMKNFPAVIRTEYGAALLVQKDTTAAQKFRERFEHCAKRYPYAAEVESERSLLELLDAKAE